MVDRVVKIAGVLMSKVLGAVAAVIVALLVWTFWEPFVADLANGVFEKIGLSGRKEKVPGLRARTGTVKSMFVPDPSAPYAFGTVEIKGELWNARCRSVEAVEIGVGDEVAVEARDGLTVCVRPVKPAAV